MERVVIDGSDTINERSLIKNMCVLKLKKTQISLILVQIELKNFT